MGWWRKKQSASGPPVVTLSCLGRRGRFGNMLFQYSFARKFAKLNNAELQTPPWLGETAFNISHPRIRRPLPATPDDGWQMGQVNVDLLGYFQNQRCMDLLSRRELKQWLAFRPEIASLFPKPRSFYAAAHLRRGDYVREQNRFCVVKKSAYESAIKQAGIAAADVIWVCDETAQSSPLEAQGLGFLADFFTLMQADVLFRANSSFSWWAATLSSARVYSPVVEDKVGMQDVPFVPGNWPMMSHPSRTGALSTDLHLPD
ncbi:MAG: hypothetical protein HKL96_09750 [Phycisphaerales bacterium]|nr:hypothetical protein [Phycisphaerales bacterium]